MFRALKQQVSRIYDNKQLFHLDYCSGLITATSDLLAEYWPDFPPVSGEVTYITFSQPVDAKYLFVQADWSFSQFLSLAEIRIVEGKIRRTKSHIYLIIFSSLLH